MRSLSHADHRKFVEAEGWQERGRARTGKADHYRYKLELANGEILYTRVSHGPGQIDDHNTVAAILREQLRVTEAEFWACVNDGVPPTRPTNPVFQPTGVPLDAKLVQNLVRRVGLTLAEVETLSKEEAVKRWQDWLAAGAEDRS
ncbi:MAG: cytotoxic translational repressor of toxin-antitoxin stability system [Candidatus Dormibacteria bacterium]